MSTPAAPVSPGPGLGVLVPEGVCVRSWRVWCYRGVGSGLPVLYTVQVWEIGERQERRWQVWAWDHWTPHWQHTYRVLPRGGWDPHFDSLTAATRRARGKVATIGGRRWQGQRVISCDLDAVPPEMLRQWPRGHAPVHAPVDPPPPWAESWPGPQKWREQLGTVAGVGTILFED